MILGILKSKEKIKSNIPEIELITKQLKNFSELANKDGTSVSYDIVKGICNGNSLFNDGFVAIQKAYMTAGAIFQEHTHNEVEVFGVIYGLLEVKIYDEIHFLSQHKVIIINPNTPHSVKATEATSFWAVTMPASGGYPNGNKSG